MNRIIALGVIVIALVALVGYGVSQSVMWAESRFGTTWTAAAVLCLIGVGIYMLSQYMAQRGVKHTLDAVADFQASSAEIVRANASAEREYARGISSQQMAQARITVLDYQHQLQQAQAQQRLLTVARQQWEVEQRQAQPAPTWAMADADDAGAGVQYYE